jgi:hypothetical protein
MVGVFGACVRFLHATAQEVRAAYGAPRSGRTAGPFPFADSDPVVIVVHNDDVHTYEVRSCLNCYGIRMHDAAQEVERTFKTVLGLPTPQARSHTEAVDKQGDVPVRLRAAPPYPCQCDHKLSSIPMGVQVVRGSWAEMASKMPGMTASGLHFSVETPSLRTAQEKAVVVAEFLEEWAGVSDATGRVIADVMAGLIDLSVDAAPVPPSASAASAAGSSSAAVLQSGSLVHHAIPSGPTLGLMESAWQEHVPEQWRGRSEAILMADPDVPPLWPAPGHPYHRIACLIRDDMWQSKPWRQAMHRTYMVLIRHNAFRAAFGIGYACAYPNVGWLCTR